MSYLVTESVILGQVFPLADNGSLEGVCDSLFFLKPVYGSKQFILGGFLLLVKVGTIMHHKVLQWQALGAI